MTYKQLEKIRKEFESLDLNRYRELTLDEMLKVNGGGSSETGESEEESDTFYSENLSSDGTSTETVSESGVDSESSGHEIENSNEAVANAEVGDTLTRDDGTQVTITQGDIDWAQNYCNEHGIDWQGEEAKSPEELQSQEDGGSSESNQTVGENTEINGEKDNSQNSSKANSEYLDYAERCRIRDEEAAAKKNAELDCPKNQSGLLFDTGTILKPTEKPSEKVENVYCSPFGNHPLSYNTENQTKTEKQVYAEAEFVDKKGETSCDLGAGLVSVSSKSNNSSVLYTEANLDIASANFNFGVTEGGLHAGFGVNGIATSGCIGIDTDKVSIHCGASVGFNTGFEFGVDFSDGLQVNLDAAFIFGGSIDIRLGGDRD